MAGLHAWGDGRARAALWESAHPSISPVNGPLIASSSAAKWRQRLSEAPRARVGRGEHARAARGPWASKLVIDSDPIMTRKPFEAFEGAGLLWTGRGPERARWTVESRLLFKSAKTTRAAHIHAGQAHARTKVTFA